MTLLLISNERDLTTDFIVRELKRRSIPFLRLNTDRLGNFKIAFDPLSSRFEMLIEGEKFFIRTVTAAYFRRPEPPKAASEVDDGSRTYVLAEWNALLKALYILVGDRWFSHPKNILLAEDKPEQLRLAKTLEFDVPPTLITNDLDRAIEFLEAGPAIAKPLRQAVVEEAGAEQVIFTSEVPGLRESDRAALQIAPVIFQRNIPKKYDLRVTVVGNRVFSAAIHSQSNAATKVDWRKGSETTLAHEKFELPPDIARKCVEFVRLQNLRFGAIDLVLDDEGQFWFLECNPNGQWAWIENRTGMPIASAIVDELEGISAR